MRASYKLIPGLLLVALVAVGCAPRNEDILQFLREHEHEVSAIEYRVGVPDAVEIAAPQALEIDGVTQQIQPDGKITLPLLGEVKIVGMTAKEIAAKLEVLLSRYYVDPQVSVRVARYESKKYYVDGPVGSPGARVYTGRDTLLDAVFESRPNFLCWLSRVKVIRPGAEPDQVRTIVVDVNRMIRRGDWGENILLEPNDIVHIPATPLGWVGLRLQELMFPAEQVRRGYAYPAQWQEAQREYEDDH